MTSIPQASSERNCIGTNEAAHILGLTASRIKQLCRAGRLPAQRVGKTWRLQATDVLEFAQAYHPIGRAAPIAERLWSRVVKTNQCWLWQGSTNNQGYGQIYYDGRGQLAHRVSWELVCGPIPDGLCLLHTCDNPRCVNPAHLQPGTMADNTDDMVAKRRCHFVLSVEQEEYVRQRWATGQVTKVGIARELGVGRMVIRRVLEGPRLRRAR